MPAAGWTPSAAGSAFRRLGRQPRRHSGIAAAHALLAGCKCLAPATEYDASSDLRQETPMALPDIRLSLQLEPEPEPEPVGIGGSVTAAALAGGPAALPVFLVAGPAALPGLAAVWIEASTRFWVDTLELAAAIGRMLFGNIAGPRLATSEASRDLLGPAQPWRPPRPRSALVGLKQPPA